MTPTEAQETLRQALAPYPLEDFLANVLGKGPLHVPGDLSGVRALLGDDPAAAILDHFREFAPKLGCHALAAKGAAPGPRRVADQAEFKGLIDAYHEQGYTVRLPEARTVTPALDRFIRALEFVFNVPVMVEIFWSRGDGRAPPHHDDFDILVIQLLGRKHWWVSTDPSPLPNAWKRFPDGKPMLERSDELVIREGDLFYMPRGTEHRVDAMAEAIHLSIGFVPVTLRDAVIAMVDELSDHDLELRTSLDQPMIAALADGRFRGLPEKVRGAVERLAEMVGDDAKVRWAMQRRAARVIERLDKLEPIPQAPPLTRSTRVRHAVAAAHHITVSEAMLEFAYPGHRIYINKLVEPQVRFIAETSAFRIGDIPGEVDDQVRIALAQKFLVSGFLTLDDAGAGASGEATGALSSNPRGPVAQQDRAAVS